MKYLFAILISLIPVTISAAAERIYSMGCIPSTPEDWERVGVSYSPSESSGSRSSSGLGCGIIQDPNRLYVPEALELKMSPVKRQGRLGTCTVFTIVACIEYLFPEYFVSEAELLIRAVTKGKRDKSDTTGTPFHLYTPFLKYEGVVQNKEFISYDAFERWSIRESLFSPSNEYKAATDAFGTAITPEVFAASQGFDTHRFSSKDIYLMQKVLSRAPIALSVPILNPSLWEGYSGENSIISKSPTDLLSTDKKVDHHAICICGFDDKLKAFKFKNSWGPTWGNNGFGWISYEYISKYASEALCYTITQSKDPKFTQLISFCRPNSLLYSAVKAIPLKRTDSSSIYKSFRRADYLE